MVEMSLLSVPYPRPAQSSRHYPHVAAEFLNGKQCELRCAVSAEHTPDVKDLVPKKGKISIHMFILTAC